MRFTPKIDLWIGILVLSVPVISVGTAIALTFTKDAADIAIGWGTVLSVVALYVGVVWPLSYELTDSQLVIRFGLVRTRIPLEDITRVRPTRNPIASPALSMHRLQLDRRNHSYALIAPADREGFLRALVARAPHVRIEVIERVPT